MCLFKYFTLQWLISFIWIFLLTFCKFKISVFNKLNSFDKFSKVKITTYLPKKKLKFCFSKDVTIRQTVRTYEETRNINQLFFNIVLQNDYDNIIIPHYNIVIILCIPNSFCPIKKKKKYVLLLMFFRYCYELIVLTVTAYVQPVGGFRYLRLDEWLGWYVIGRTRIYMQ